MVALQVVMLAAQVIVSALMTPYVKSAPLTSVSSTLFGAAAMLVYPVVGAIIFTRRPRHPIGWLFCIAQAGWALVNFVHAFGQYALHARPDLLPLASTLIWFDTWPGYVSTGLLLFLILLFPDGRLPSPRWKPAAWLIAGWAGLCMVIYAFAPGIADPNQALPFRNPLGVGGVIGSLLSAASSFVDILVVPLGALVAASLVLRFRSAGRRADGGQAREQLKWLAVAIVTVVLCWLAVLMLLIRYPTTAVTPFWAQVLEWIAINSQMLIPIAAGIAILRYRLYEIDRFIHQALVYFSLTAALALVYFVCIVGLQTLFSAVTGEGQSSVATVLSTLAIAALFTPLRRRLQNAIDRRFYRQKYNTQVILDRFSGVLRNEVDLQLMSDQLVGVVDETFQPNQISLWITKRQ